MSLVRNNRYRAHELVSQDIEAYLAQHQNKSLLALHYLRQCR